MLLSSRSGVRVPSGVPSLAPSLARLEQLNPTCRWHVDREGLTERLLDSTSPSWRAKLSDRLVGLEQSNMVDIAQLVSASDCGSEGRGFESHYPPHKKRHPTG